MNKNVLIVIDSLYYNYKFSITINKNLYYNTYYKMPAVRLLYNRM